MSSMRAWLGQVTTGHGAMVLGPTLLAVAGGQMTWHDALPLLVAGIIGLVWPENTALKSAAQSTATDIDGLIAAFQSGQSAGFADGQRSPGAAASSNSVSGGLRAIAPLVLLMLAGVGLAACGQTVAGVALPPAPQTPSQALYEVEATFDIAVQQASVYAALPRCGAPGATAVCSVQATALTLYHDAEAGSAAIGTAKAALAVYAALKAPAASDTQAVLAAVQSASGVIAPLTALLSTLKVS